LVFVSDCMITHIPTSSDYEKSALSMLNLSWEMALQLAIQLDEAKEDDNEVEEATYWAACHTQLTTSISLVQQALEFQLKSRIVAVSPYLLIAGPPKNWPQDCDTTDLPFADFYAVEAQDLLRAHDTVSNQRVPQEIKQLFESVRKLRNRIMHTVDARLKVEVPQVIIAVLEIANWCIGCGKWTDARRQHIELSPNSIAYAAYSDHSTFIIARELLKAVEILKPAEVQNLLGFDKKARRYACPECALECSDDGMKPNLAFLVPNTPTSTNVHCYVCGRDCAVVRRNCSAPDCKGNVISVEEMLCLTCLKETEEQAEAPTTTPNPRP